MVFFCACYYYCLNFQKKAEVSKLCSVTLVLRQIYITYLTIVRSYGRIIGKTSLSVRKSKATMHRQHQVKFFHLKRHAKMLRLK